MTSVTVSRMDGIAVHELDTDYYDDGELAYAYTQTRDGFTDGAVLVWGDVVAVMFKAWPCSITTTSGGFERMGHGQDWRTIDDGRYAQAYRVAAWIATERGMALWPNPSVPPGDPDCKPPSWLTVSRHLGEDWLNQEAAARSGQCPVPPKNGPAYAVYQVYGTTVGPALTEAFTRDGHLFVAGDAGDAWCVRCAREARTWPDDRVFLAPDVPCHVRPTGTASVFRPMIATFSGADCARSFYERLTGDPHGFRATAIVHRGLMVTWLGEDTHPDDHPGYGSYEYGMRETVGYYGSSRRRLAMLNGKPAPYEY